MYYAIKAVPQPHATQERLCLWGHAAMKTVGCGVDSCLDSAEFTVRSSLNYGVMHD